MSENGNEEEPQPIAAQAPLGDPEDPDVHSDERGAIPASDT